MEWVSFSRRSFGGGLYANGVTQASGKVRSYAPEGPECAVLRIWSEPEQGFAAEQDLSALAPFLGSGKNADEHLLTAYLALLSSGQIGIDRVPGLAVEPQRKR